MERRVHPETIAMLIAMWRKLDCIWTFLPASAFVAGSVAKWLKYQREVGICNWHFPTISLPTSLFCKFIKRVFIAFTGYVRNSIRKTRDIIYQRWVELVRFDNFVPLFITSILWTFFFNVIVLTCWIKSNTQNTGWVKGREFQPKRPSWQHFLYENRYFRALSGVDGVWSQYVWRLVSEFVRCIAIVPKDVGYQFSHNVSYQSRICKKILVKKDYLVVVFRVEYNYNYIQ